MNHLHDHSRFRKELSIMSEDELLWKYDEGLVVGTHVFYKMHQDMSHSKLVLMYYVKCYNSAYSILRMSEWPGILANILARNFLKQVSGSGSRGPVIELGSRRPTSSGGTP